MEDTAKRSNSVTVKIWAGLHGSEASLLLEWRVQLCCLRFIGKELRDIPAGLPNNTILFGFENGFYTAPDEEDMMDHHDHINAQDSIPPHTMTSRSYTYESVMRLNNLHECIADTKRSRDEIKNNIEVALNKDNAPMIMVWSYGSNSILLMYPTTHFHPVDLVSIPSISFSKNVGESARSDSGIFKDKLDTNSMFLKRV